MEINTLERGVYLRGRILEIEKQLKNCSKFNDCTKIVISSERRIYGTYDELELIGHKSDGTTSMINMIKIQIETNLKIVLEELKKEFDAL